MFRAMILPIIRSIRLYNAACGMNHPQAAFIYGSSNTMPWPACHRRCPCSFPDQSMCDLWSTKWYWARCCRSTVEHHLSGLIGTTSHPDTQNMRIIRFFFENRLHWQIGVRLLQFTSKPFRHA